jgi:hypothetical protein
MKIWSRMTFPNYPKEENTGGNRSTQFEEEDETMDFTTFIPEEIARDSS